MPRVTRADIAASTGRYTYYVIVGFPRYSASFRVTVQPLRRHTAERNRAIDRMASGRRNFLLLGALTRMWIRCRRERCAAGRDAMHQRSMGTLILLLALASCARPATPARYSATPVTVVTATGTPHLPTPQGSISPTALSLRALPTFGPTPSVRPPYCGSGESIGEPITYPSAEAQTWASDQVVVGTIETQEARWKVVGGYPYIMTYSLLRVEGRARGWTSDALFIVTSGGTLEGCTQRSNSPTLERGARYLLFLLDENNRSAIEPMPIYLINGGEAGRQPVMGNRGPDLLLVPLRQALAQPPPSDLRKDFVVPLAHAPITPLASATATPATSGR